MLPVLTFTPKRWLFGRRRLVLAVGGAGLLVLSILSTLVALPSRSADE